MGEIPESSNVFICLYAALSPAQVAALFGEHGWHIRRCGWTSFEIRSSCGELVIEDGNPILIHGPVANVERRIDEIVQPLVVRGIPHEIDCYGNANELIIQRRFIT